MQILGKWIPCACIIAARNNLFYNFVIIFEKYIKFDNIFSQNF